MPGNQELENRSNQSHMASLSSSKIVSDQSDRRLLKSHSYSRDHSSCLSAEETIRTPHDFVLGDQRGG